MILYFSGTGNSEYVAKRLTALTGEEAVSITDRIRKRDHKKIVSEEPLVFVTPTYGWRIPRLVEEWITKMTFEGSGKAYFLMTCGGSVGNAGQYLKKLCEKKQFTYMGCQQVVMPENYVAMFPVPEEGEAKEIVNRAEPVICDAAERISQGLPLEEKHCSLADRIMSGVINQVFYACFVRDKKFYATEDCIGCGACAAVCPLHNISLKEGKPVWNGRCTHCMACICDCPKEAIEYGKASKGKPRYHCPM